MAESTVIQSGRPSEFSPDPLTEVIGSGARELTASAVQAEATDFLARHEHLVDERGRRRMVRHGTLPEREVMTVTGPVPVEVPRVRDRGAGVAAGGEDQVPFVDRAALSEENEVRRGPAALALSQGHLDRRLRRGGRGASRIRRRGLTSSTITRLKARWKEEYGTWSRRDLSGRRFVYVWAGRGCFTPRPDGDRQCMLVVTGADEYGEKDAPAVTDGFRENADSWRDLLRDLKERGPHRRARGPAEARMFTICSRHRPSRRSPGRRPEGPGQGPVKPESAGFGPVTGKTRGFLADTK